MERRSRRQFLNIFTDPAKRAAQEIARPINDLRSENEQGTSGLVFADRVTEIGAEGIVFLFALTAGLDAITNKMYVMEVTPRERMGDNPEAQARTEKTLHEARTGLYDLSRVLELLAQEWKKYKKMVRKETKEEDCDEDGNCKEVVKVTYEPEWQEPYEFTSRGIDHNTIDNIFGYIRSLDEKFIHALQQFARVPSFKYRDESYDFGAKALDTKTQTIGRGIGFGVSALAFTFYEELIAKTAQHSSMLPEALAHLSETKIKRRSAIKVVGGMAVIGQIRGFQAGIAQQNTTFDDEVRKKARSFIEYGLTMSSDAAFHAYFGQTVDEQIASLKELTQHASTGVSSGTTGTENWHRIAPLLRDVHTQLVAVSNNLKKNYRYADRLEYTLPPELGFVARNMMIHKWVQGYVGQRNFETSVSWLGETALFALSLVGIAAGAEVIAEVSDRAINKALYQRLS